MTREPSAQEVIVNRAFARAREFAAQAVHLEAECESLRREVLRRKARLAAVGGGTGVTSAAGAERCAD